MELTNAARKSIVTETKVFHFKRGDSLFPKMRFEEGKEPEEVWRVLLILQSGLLPPQFISKYFETKAELEGFLSKYQAGSECNLLDKELKDIFFDEKLTFDSYAERGIFPIEAGDPFSSVVTYTLMNAGIMTPSGQTSNHIFDALGAERVKQISDKYGENWKAVVMFEYCFNFLPSSSPAYIAAAQQFCYWVLNDDFKAGYLLRDLEILVHGVEEKATKSIETRKKAGQSGSKKSAQAREMRRKELVEKMINVVERNPDFVRLGDESVAIFAADECFEENPLLWKQGRGQAIDYIGEIRRGEAGKDLQAKYEAIFRPKTA